MLTIVLALARITFFVLHYISKEEALRLFSTENKATYNIYNIYIYIYIYILQELGVVGLNSNFEDAQFQPFSNPK